MKFGYYSLITFGINIAKYNAVLTENKENAVALTGLSLAIGGLVSKLGKPFLEHTKSLIIKDYEIKDDFSPKIKGWYNGVKDFFSVPDLKRKAIYGTFLISMLMSTSLYGPNLKKSLKEYKMEKGKIEETVKADMQNVASRDYNVLIERYNN